MKKKKKSSKKAAKKVAKKVAKKKKEYKHHPDHYNTSEEYLITPLEDDLRDAWEKIREFAGTLGPHRRYASGRAIMFSKKVCFFFVRPKKSYLEVVIFLTKKRADSDFKIAEASKTKFSHTFKLIHADQVEGELPDAIIESYNETPSA